MNSLTTFPVFKQSKSLHASTNTTQFGCLFSMIVVNVDPVIPGGRLPVM